MKKTNSVNPKVTIVIPVYNGAKYIRYAIDSALRQTYDNLEILVVNDGSTDNTEKIVRSYGDKVRYIKKENGGVSTALNLAVEKMKGEYFSWLSHDDTYEPDKVECEIKFLRDNGYLGKKVIAFSDYFLIDENGDLINEYKVDPENAEKRPEWNLLKSGIDSLGLLIPKTAFDDCGGFDLELSCAQDYELWWRMLKKYKFVHVPETLVNTRVHKAQKTQTSPKVATEGNEFCRQIVAELSEKRIKEIAGSRCNFLLDMVKVHKGGPYNEFAEECEAEVEKKLEDVKDTVKKKKVSVIIPFYNRVKLVKRAIESVLRQTHKNIEIVLVNDGSEEDVSEIRKMAKVKKLVLIDNKKNLGASGARNVGIKAATGEYIAFLDSDDEFLENKIEVQLSYMVATETVISHTSYARKKIDGDDEIESGRFIYGYSARILMQDCPIVASTIMIKREWLLERGVLFNTNLEVGQDRYFLLELLKGNETYLLGINKVLSVIYIGGDSMFYDRKKQAMELKSAIGFLLNDDYYSKFDEEIAAIMGAFLFEKELTKRQLWVEDGAKSSNFRKLKVLIEKEGIRTTGKKVVNKVRRKITNKKG